MRTLILFIAILTVATIPFVSRRWQQSPPPDPIVISQGPPAWTSLDISVHR